VLALALGIEVALIVAFFRLNGRARPETFRGGAIATFDVQPIPDSTPEPPRSIQQPRPSQPVARQPIPTTAPPAPAPTPELDMLIVTKDVYAASDIAKLGTASGKVAAAASAAAGDSQMVGNAPNGQPLYAAEWFREPTRRELGFYLPKRMPQGGGWGMIACKTAPRHRVTDCVVLGNGPAGSGLGRAVLNASWQFLVRAPRRGGKDLVGEWVRIRIDYTPE
jgi:protein TonB